MRLKELREEIGISQVELAKKIGISNKNIHAYEKGYSEPAIDVLIKLADFFNCSVDFLIERTDDYNIVSSSDTNSYKDRTLLRMFHLLDDTTQDQVIDYTKYQADKFINLNELKRS